MEGFFSPPDERIRGIKVPFVARLEYDGPGPPFSGFADRKGFSAHNRIAHDLDFHGRSTQELASLLQSWLFFGLLNEFFGRRINPLFFVERHDPSGNAVCIDQDIVHNLFIDWKNQLAAMPSETRRGRKEYIENILEIALARSELFDQLPQEPSGSPIPAIALSVKLMIMLLQSVADDTFNDIRHPLVDFFHRRWFMEPFLERRRKSTAFRKIQEVKEQKLFLPLPPGNEKPSPAAKLLLNRLIRNGWCIHKASQVCQTHDYLVVNYLSFLHRKTPPWISHEACLLSDKCVAYDVNLADHNTYQQHHVESGCQCELMSVPTDEVLAIIEKGGVPIISMKSKQNQIDLKVVKCQPWTRFAAISHVWSDGLGNAMGNTLPRCQLQRLNERLALSTSTPAKSGRRGGPSNNIDSSKGSHRYFWMDTLCIPAGSNDDEYLAKMKSKAISRMAPVYACATHVLVLDSELENSISSQFHSDGSHNDDEIFAHVLCSAWNSRTWTLQEAVLARSCYFQLANGPRGLHTDSWIQFFSKGRWSGPTRKFERGGELQEERLDLRSREARRLHGSPLLRHITRFSSQFPALVIQELQEDKKYLSTLPSAPERLKAVAALRVPQFVRAWNSLLCRSTTQPEDKHGIFANLLDFNAYHIRRTKNNQRLPMLIRSCSELPLSLLYNKGPRLNCSDCPQNGWIPSEIAGDRLAGDGVLSMAKDGLTIDATRCPPDSLMIFLVPHGVPRSSNFCLQDQRSGQEFAIEIQDNHEELEIPASANSHDDNNPRALTCLIIDKSTGSSSRNGYAATGARLIVSRTTDGAVYLNYDKPLIARTPHQCTERHFTTARRTELIVAGNVRFSWRFIINYDPSSWGKPLPRRSLLSTHPTYPILIPYLATLAFILLTASISLVLGITGFVQVIATLYLWLAECLVGVLVVFPAVHYFCMLTSYQAWVATFGEDWVPESRWARWAWIAHVWGILRAWFGSWAGDRRRTERSTTDVEGREREPLIQDAV